jgi:peptide subunit release factor 1 (eRF1)
MAFPLPGASCDLTCRGVGSRERVVLLCTPEPVSAAGSLADEELDVAITVSTPTLTDVQWLADHPRGEGMVVSCYADTSVSSGVRPLWREHLKNEIKRLDEAFAGAPAARAAFHRNVAAIERVLSARRPVAARGMAVFAALERNLVYAYTLGTPPPNRLVVDEEPYLMPLLELLVRQRRYLVVHTDTQRGRLYTSVPGAVRLIEELREWVPRRQRAAGERWGKQQATIARHREDHVRHYLKDLAAEVARAWPEERYDGIVLLGEHAVLRELRTYLPVGLHPRIVAETPHPWVGRQSALEEKIAAIQAAAVEDDDRRALDEVKRRLLERHLVATGPGAVLDAIHHGQLAYPGRIVMESDGGEVGSRCTTCGWLLPHVTDKCPLCGARCERTNLWQAITLLATRHGIPVHIVAAGSGLDKHGGMAALLARAAAETAGHSTGERTVSTGQPA